MKQLFPGMPPERERMIILVSSIAGIVMLVLYTRNKSSNSSTDMISSDGLGYYAAGSGGYIGSASDTSGDTVSDNVDTVNTIENLPAIQFRISGNYGVVTNADGSVTSMSALDSNSSQAGTTGIGVSVKKLFGVTFGRDHTVNNYSSSSYSREGQYALSQQTNDEYEVEGVIENANPEIIASMLAASIAGVGTPEQHMEHQKVMYANQALNAAYIGGTNITGSQSVRTSGISGIVARRKGF
jgi:hypothetical protein